MQDKTFTDGLWVQAYEELRVLASRYLSRQGQGFTLGPTEIVHEAFLHLIEHGRNDWTDVTHLRAIATCKMWQIIVDYLKRRRAAKRGGLVRHRTSLESQRDIGEPDAGIRGWKRTPLDLVTIEWHDRNVDLLDLADALDDLAAESRRLRDVVKLHWFGGLTHAEVAQVLGLSASTVEKDFRYALAWLNRRLQGATPYDG